MQKRRLFASTSLAAKFPELPSAPFTWTRAGFEREIGFSGFEHLAAPSSPSRQRRGLSGRSHLSWCRSAAVGWAGAGPRRHHRVCFGAGRALDRGLPASCREADAL